MTSTTAIIHLPAEVVQGITSRPSYDSVLFKSFVHKPDMAEWRRDYMVEGLMRRPDANPGRYINFIDNRLRGMWATTELLMSKEKAAYGQRFMDAGNGKHMRKLLHIASCNGDLLLAHEMLRWGARTDFKDGYGDTPLASGLQAALLYHDLSAELIAKMGPQFAANAMPFLSRRPAAIIDIAKLLVSHHSDVNVDTPVGMPLRIACELGDWELIELLLAHGADPERAFREKTRFEKDKKSAARLARLISAASKREGRPPRLCPCCSGQPQSECHTPGKKLPYPKTFLCPCVSGKQYGQCCAASVEWEEGWDDKEEWIAPVRKHSPKPLPPLDVALLKSKLVVAEAESSIAGFRLVLQTLLDESRIDRAFAHVARQLKALPPASSSPVPTTTAKAWNEVVEKHIPSDGRDTRTVGMTAMVDPDGGTFFRRCALPTCGRVEEVRALHQRCSGCKAMYYCNGKCQMLHWKEHKAVCKTRPPQMLLPSHQAVLDAYHLLSTS